MCSFSTNFLLFSRTKSHSHSSWSDLPPFPLPQHTPSLHYPSRSDEQSLDPRTARRSGRSTIQSPLTLPRSSMLRSIHVHVSLANMGKQDSGHMTCHPERITKRSRNTSIPICLARKIELVPQPCLFWQRGEKRVRSLDVPL